MPRYIYRCKECEEEIQRTHSIKEKLKDCELCGTEDSLMRVPSGFMSKVKTEARKQKPGNLVKDFIKNAKDDLKEQKSELESKR